MSFPLDRTKYEILTKIGKGATAEVFVVKLLSTNELIAAKIIDLETCPIEIETLYHEVAFWRNSQSQNIINYYGSFVSESSCFILMEYMSAGSCYEIMKYAYPKGFSNEIVIAEILQQVLMALNYFHENKQIHRDVKAGNILLNDKGEVKMGDFGIAANLIEKGQRKRAKFTVIGTPCYMAPEVLKEEEGYTEKADIWSLGITAIELATGSAPYSGLFPLEVIVKIINSPPPQLPDDSKWSTSFRDFVRTCLINPPSKRPSAKQLLEHKFFKQAKDYPYYTKELVQSLPPLTERFEINNNSKDIINKKLDQNVITWNFEENDNKKIEIKKELEVNLPIKQQITEIKKVEEIKDIKKEEEKNSPIKDIKKEEEKNLQIKKINENKKEEENKNLISNRKINIKVEKNSEENLHDKEQIDLLENEIIELKSKINNLKKNNVILKEQIDVLANKVRSILK